MYAYIFDSFLQERKYQHDIGQIENRLSLLGIQGKIEKMTILKNIQETARQAIKRGVETLVIVGNDETISKILPLVAEAKLTLGLIPLGPNQTIAKILGIPVGVAACDALSRRIIRKLDLGQANSAYFLFQLTSPINVTVDCGDFAITSIDPVGEITIANFPVENSHSLPDDGQLELIVAPGTQKNGWAGKQRSSTGSVFPITKVKITTKQTPTHVLLDGQISIKTPVTVEVAKSKLAIIVGKDRGF